MSKFYQSIAKHYDDIFPLSDTLKRFLLPFGIRKEDHILDVGCATGEVALYLAQYVHTVTGIDLDPDLIKIARLKQGKSEVGSVRFLIGDMNDLDSMFTAGQFRIVLCLGNTLVHLQSTDAINDFFRKVAVILADGGLFIFQILNYAKILDQKTGELPLIDNEKIIFERRYDHELRNPLLAFNTRLTVKATSEAIGNSIDLYPLQYGELIRMPSNQLYQSIQFLGGFDGKIFSEEGDLLIGVWEK
jgi:2-polyprenyl-3-methyl-5-hydroxy-6-metoxy-1,4-benzoquinol methylase